MPPFQPQVAQSFKVEEQIVSIFYGGQDIRPSQGEASFRDLPDPLATLHCLKSWMILL